MKRQSHQDAPTTGSHRGNWRGGARDDRDTEVKETNQSCFDPAGVKSLFNVDERGKGLLMAAEAQGVHKTEDHSIGTPAETPLRRVELWKNVGRNASINQVLENFESA